MNDVIKQLVEIIRDKYKPEMIILYGSYAWGNPTRHSDIDLFIVKNTRRTWVDRFVKVKEIIFDPKRGIPVSPCVYTPQEVRERMQMGDQFVKEIFSRGITLFERDGRKRTNPVI